MSTAAPLLHDLIIADSSVTGIDQLLSVVVPGTEVWRVDAGSDIIAMLRSALSSGFRSLHLLGHGKPGAVHFGSRSLGIDDFASLAVLNADTAPSMHFWSCMTGAGESGRTFVDGISKFFRTAVTAFSGLVGAKELGGSWMPDICSSQMRPVLLPFSDTSVFAQTLVVSDTEAPVLKSTFNSGNRLILNFSEPISGVDSDSFEIRIAGVATTVTGFSVNGNKLILTLGSFSVPGDLVTVSYAGLSIQDVSGNSLSFFSAASFVLSSKYSGTLFDNDRNGSFDYMQVVETYTNESGVLEREKEMYRVIGGDDPSTTADFIAQKVMTFDFGSLDASGRPISFYDENGEISITWAAEPIHGGVATAPLTFYTVNPSDPDGEDVEQHGTIFFFDQDGDDEFDSMDVWYGPGGTQLFARLEVTGYTCEGDDPVSMTTVITWIEDGGGDIFDFTIDNGKISLPADEFESDDEQPWYQKMTVSGNTVTLAYNEILDAAHLPSAGAFTVLVNGTGDLVTGVSAENNLLLMTVNTAIPVGASVTVTYADPTTGNDVNAIQDINGNDAASLNTGTGSGGESDTTQPTITSATVNGSSMTLTYNESLDPVHKAGANWFGVQVNGSSVGVSVVTVSGNSVTLGLNNSVQQGATVTISYTDPTTGNDAYAIQDSAGNDAASFANYAVTNNSNGGGYTYNYYEFHEGAGSVVAWVGSEWFRLDLSEDGDGDDNTWTAALTFIDQEDGHTRPETGTFTFIDTDGDNVIDQWRAALDYSDTIPLMGDSDMDGKPDGFYADEELGVDLEWQSRDTYGVVATFAFADDYGSVSGSLLDLDGNGEADYARITENGATTMQKIALVDTDGDAIPDDLEVTDICRYDGDVEVDDSGEPQGIWFSGEDEEISNDAAPLLSLDNSTVAIYHYKAAGIIDGADADATDADGNMLVFTLDGAPDDGSGNPLFAINAETGQISLTQAGAEYIHDAALSETFDLTVRVTDGEADHDQTAELTIVLTGIAASYECAVNVYWLFGGGIPDVTVMMTDESSNETTGQPLDWGAYDFGTLEEGEYTLTATRAADAYENDLLITVDDAEAALDLALGHGGSSPYQYLAADIDRDGTVGFRDALGILKMALHRQDAPEPEWAFVPASTGSEPMDSDNVNWPDDTIPVTLDQDKEIDLVGVLLGDVVLAGLW